jgi:hypothetical protein
MEYVAALLSRFILSLTLPSRAYERKHGHRAWLQRYEKLEAQRAEARELEELRRYQEEFRRMDVEREKREGPPHPS